MLNIEKKNRRALKVTSRQSFSSARSSKVLDKSAGQTPKHTVQVFDENGQDVTPRPLLLLDPGAAQSKLIFTGLDTSGATMTDYSSEAFQTTTASWTGPFTRSFSESISASRVSQSTAVSVIDETEDLKQGISSPADDQGRGAEVQEDMLDSLVDCYLTETETIWLLDIPAVSVSVDSENAEAVKERNNAYTELCKNRQGNDKYVERSMQTFNDAPKTKEVQSERITTVDKDIMCTNWDMYDSFYNGTGGVSEEAAVSSEREKVAVSAISPGQHLDFKGSDQSVSVFSTTSIASDLSSHLEMEASVPQVEEETDLELILQSDKFKQDLAVMERVILQNIFQPKLAAYRQLPVIEDPDCVRTAREVQSWTDQSENSPSLEHLWTFRCELTMGRNVSSMAWNKKNPDLLAVGYGQFDFKDQKSGLVCCWSLKNPTWPERIFHCESGVTALDFSASNPSQLAVGMYDGRISIYNVQSTEQTPIMDSSDCAHIHTRPVWQVKWIIQESGPHRDKEETLISLSADGRISKWFLRKGLECTDLMKLKRTSSERSTKQDETTNGMSLVLIPHQASGLCFDFHPTASNIYLAGTEEGQIHKCSYSYNEHFLDTYKGHKGPVYKITWSPFSPDVFLSCSSDWTVQLWRQDLLTPVLSFTSSQKAVYDIMWSPRRATVFGAVTEGRVEIWDLGASILDPTIVSICSPDVKPTALLFTPETDCVLVGDSDGQVTVYKLQNFTPDSEQMDTLEDIIQSTLVSQL